MMNTTRTGRHRKPSPARVIAARTALSATGAAAALLVAAGPATAGTNAGAAPAAPVAEAPCTNTPLDAVIGPLAQTDCNDPAPASPDDVTGDDPTDEGSGNGSGNGSGSGPASEREGQPASPGVPFPGNGGNPPDA